MRGPIHSLLTFGIAYLTQVRAIEHSSLISPRDANAGGARICYTSPAINGYSPKYPLCHDICANEATKCLSRGDLKAQIVGGGDHNAFLSSINPYKGGHCLVYATADCADNTAMPLKNPNHFNLKFPR